MNEEAHRRFKFYTFLQGGRGTTAKKNRIKESGSLHLCMGEKINGNEEANRSFTLYAFLHGERETTAMKKCIEASRSMNFCVGEKTTAMKSI